MQTAERVLVIGLDGGTFDVFRPLAEQGGMPNLARLMRRGNCRTLQSTEPAITPTAWSTFLTGCDPQSHGILDYRYFDHQQRTVRLNHALRLERRTLYEYIADAGGRVVSLNLPMTYPPRGNGIIVGGLDSPSISAALKPHPEFATRLQALNIPYGLNPVWKRRPSTFGDLVAGVARTQRNFASRASAAQLADRLGDWQLMTVQFQTLDALQHYCWPYLGHDANQPQTPWVKEAQRALASLDRAVGDLLELAERRRAAVVALSDHGFGPFRQQISLSALLQQHKLMVPGNLATRLRYHGQRAVQRLRKWRWRRQQASSTAGIARQLEGLLPIDWRRTKAVALHGNLGALIYLNRPERFGCGPLIGATAVDQTAEEVIELLSTVRHPATDEPLFTDVYRTCERYGTDPLAKMLPDVVGIPAPGFHTRTRFDTSGHLMRDEPGLTATHRRDGMLVVEMAGVGDIREGDAQLRDVAPTILALLGVAGGDQMDGQNLLARDHTAPTARVRFDAPHVPRGPLVPAQSAEVETRLRDLGYLE